jgi:hypothetical protein
VQTASWQVLVCLEQFEAVLVLRDSGLLSCVLFQYGFVCVVTGASQPVGQAIIEELAGEHPRNPQRDYLELTYRTHTFSAHGAASIYGTSAIHSPSPISHSHSRSSSP